MTSPTAASPASPASFQYEPEHLLLALPQAMFVLQADRSLAFVNHQAQHLFDDGRAQRIAGRLMRVGQLDAAKLEELLKLARDGHPARAGLWFAPSVKTGWLHACPLSPIISRSANWPADSLLLTVNLDAPELTQCARIEALCRQCAITRTERQVLMLLADGISAQDAAHQLGLKLSTIRTHIRNLLGKTQASSLMALSRTLGSARPMLA